MLNDPRCRITLNFHADAPAALSMVAVGCDHLEASARHLVAGATDASLAHAMCAAVETVTKGVLASLGTNETELRNLGHVIEKACTELARRSPGPNDAEYLTVSRTMPALVTSRYEPKQMNALEASDLYRRALFLCAEALRRTNHDSLYRQFEADPQVPMRKW